MRAIILFALLLLLTSIIATADSAAESLYESGRVAANRGDFMLAWRLWAPLAEKGDAQAQGALGLLYARGDGVAKDIQKARYWFEKAASQRDSRAEFNLGKIYYYGDGVARDEERARSLFERAIKDGSRDAIDFLGSIDDQYKSRSRDKTLEDASERQLPDISIEGGAQNSIFSGRAGDKFQTAVKSKSSPSEKIPAAAGNSAGGSLAASRSAGIVVTILILAGFLVIYLGYKLACYSSEKYDYSVFSFPRLFVACLAWVVPLIGIMVLAVTLDNQRHSPMTFWTLSPFFAVSLLVLLPATWTNIRNTSLPVGLASTLYQVIASCAVLFVVIWVLGMLGGSRRRKANERS